MYTIKPIFLGTFPQRDRSCYTHGKNHGVAMNAAMMSFLVQGNGLTILVDTGSTLSRCELEKALHALGCEPSQVDSVILTHLHGSHCSNLSLFTRAPVYVQQKEMHYALIPLPTDTWRYDGDGSIPVWLENVQRMKPVEGDAKLTLGIELVALPGHTPGTQGVLVSTSEGRYLIAGDMYPLHENSVDGVPPGHYVDLFAWFASHEKASKLCDHVLPGHDIQVLERKIYGKAY